MRTPSKQGGSIKCAATSIGAARVTFLCEIFFQTEKTINLSLSLIPTHPLMDDKLLTNYLISSFTCYRLAQEFAGSLHLANLTVQVPLENNFTTFNDTTSKFYLANSVLMV